MAHRPIGAWDTKISLLKYRYTTNASILVLEGGSDKVGRRFPLFFLDIELCSLSLI